MQTITDHTYNGETVELDDHVFIRCRFTNCILHLRGGKVAWRDTEFDDCRIILLDAANNVVQILTGLGYKIIPPQGKPPRSAEWAN